MALTSIKVKQPREINSGKNARKGKGREDYSIRVPANKRKKSKSIK